MSPIVIVVVALLGLTFAADDWCAVQKQLCKGKEHIACTPNSFATTKCDNLKLETLTSAQKNFIVQKHNEYRQQVASGSISKLPSANKMGEMKWDNTLETLAQTHVKHCTFSHDKCRATPDYPHSGQNLYKSSTTRANPNVTEAIGSALTSWFEEYKDVSASLIKKYESNDSGTGHFLVMVKDVNTRVGCAAITFTTVKSGKTYYNVQITCNYQDTNMKGDPTYTEGKPCSACTRGCSSTYKALCST